MPRSERTAGFELAVMFALGVLTAEGCEHIVVHPTDADAQDCATRDRIDAKELRVLTIALAAEEGREPSDGHAALLWTLHERADAVGITVAEEAVRYCSALRGMPQSEEGALLLTLDDDTLRLEAPHVWKLVLVWLSGGKPENPCRERPWHFGGRNAAAQRPNARVLACGDARSTFFARPRARAGRR